MKHTTKWIALFVCLAMLLGSVPVFAANGQDMSAELEAGDVTLTTDGDYYFHDVHDTRNQIIVADNRTVNITVENMSTGYMDDATAPLVIGDNCEVTLTVLGTVNWESGYDYSGIVVLESSTLSITGDGTLNVTSGGRGAGIGGYGDGNHAGTIIIGGVVTVNATGGYNGAGIGGGENSNGASILIKDSAVVHAQGDTEAAGIGGGYMGACGDVTVMGSASVYARGYCGIGGGYMAVNTGTLAIDNTACVVASSTDQTAACSATYEGSATVFGINWQDAPPNSPITINTGGARYTIPRPYSNDYSFMASLPMASDYLTVQSDTHVYGHEDDASNVMFATAENNTRHLVQKGAAIASTTPPTLDLVVEEQPDGSCKLVFDVGEDNLANMSAFYYSLDGGSFQKADGNKADIASDFAGNVTV